MAHAKTYAHLLGKTQAHYRVERLTGPHNATVRSELLSLLTGTRATRRESGINALVHAALSAFAVPTCKPDGAAACLAIRLETLSELTRSIDT